MYNTTDFYKSKIYNVNHFLKVYVNDVEIESKYILDCRPSSTLFTNGEIELGSTPSQTIELKLYKSVVPATINKVEIKSGITGEIVPLGVYNVDKAPTSDDYTVTLSLADNMIKFEFNYDGSKLVNDSDGKVKIIRVLQDICSKANVELGSTSFLNMNKVISVYDNTVSARTYLSYIAEQAGGFAFIGRDGKLYIKSFKYALGKKIGEGKSIVIEKTNNLRAKTVIKGEHSQKTTEGKNVLNPKMETKTANGITIGNNGSNVNQIIINGNTKYRTAMSFDEILQLEENEYYTMSFRVISGSCTNYATDRNWAIKFYPEQYEYQPLSLDISAGNTQKSLCFKASGKARKPYFWFGWEKRDECIEGQTGVFKNLVLEMQIEKGKSLTSFEYYTGAKPSPNTNYQQEVETVGKVINIFDYITSLRTEADGLKNKLNEDGSITTSGKPTNNYVKVCSTIDVTDELEDGETYTILQETVQASLLYIQLAGLKVDGTFTYFSASQDNKVNFTVDKKTYKKYLIYVQSGTLANWGTESRTITNKYMLYKGSERRPFSKYNQRCVQIIKSNKNRLKLPEQVVVSNGVTSTFKDGNLKLKGTLTNYDWCFAYSRRDLYLKKGTYSCSVSGLDKQLEVRMHLKNGTTSSFWLASFARKKTVTFNSDIIGCTLVYHHAEVDYEVDISVDIQLETGEKFSDFVVPKQENFIIPFQQELLEGDYIDSTEHHTWEKLILDGSERWNRAATNDSSKFRFFLTFSNILSTPIVSIGQIVSNCFEAVSSATAGTYGCHEGISQSEDRIYIYTEKANTSTSDFIAWLKEMYDAGTPVVVYYKLATPIELELTDDQKKVLKEIHNMNIYEDYTIIESEAEMQVNFARAEIPFKYFQNFEWGAKYKLSKIRYEDGIRVFEKGDDTGNTLYINPDNMFIVDQDQIDNIYDELKDLELYSFKGDSIVDPGLDTGDIVVIDGKQVLYCGSSQYSGRWKASINSEIKSKERQETTVVKKPSQKTINRRVQSSIDQVNGKIEQLIEENTETSKTLTKHEQTLEGFTNTVSKVEQDIENVKSTANSSVKKVEVKYALSDSSTEAPATGWNTTAPTWTEGKYMWQKTVTTFVDGSVSESNATCIQGAKGADGIDGKDGKDGVNGEKGDTGASGKDGQTYYTWVKYADSPTAGMSDNPAGKTYIGFAYNKTTSVESTNYSDYSWSLIKGEKGDTGDKGEVGKSGTDGNGIKKIDYYYTTTTTQTAPTASNITSTSIPKLSETNKYLWRKEVITFTTTTTPQTTVTLLAIYGDKGIAGDKGADGKTTYFHIKYSSVANPTASQMTETPSAYIGTYVDYTAKDSTDPTKYTWSRFQGVQGEKGEKGIPGIDGTNGKTSYLHIAYANSADGKTDFNVSDSTNKTYIGQYTDFVETDSTDPTKYSWTKIKGEVGQQGKTGATGKGIKSVQDQYYLSTSNTKQTGGAWKNTQDEWQEGKYIWTRSFITWTDNATSYTTPCLADSINKANQVASDTAKNLENNYSTTKETETMIKQESESIRLEVETIEKFTRDITSRRELHLVDTADYAENLVLTLKIFGDTEKWKELVPSTSLAPGLTVAPLGTTIDLIVDSQSRLNQSEDKQVFTINYGKKLRSLGNVRDELDIINNKVTVIRRIGLNERGQEYVLQTEQTEELGELKLPTLKGNTYIYVREYPNLEYFCRYITDNDYIKKFATQEELKEATVELNTKIEQTNQEIKLMARKKVGKDEVIASINISPEQIKILAQKLQISAEDVLNIIAGNTINLTSKNLTINSKYLNIDSDGNLIIDTRTGWNVFNVINSRYPNRSIYINEQYIGINSEYEQNCIVIGPVDSKEGSIALTGKGWTRVSASGITTPAVTQTSTESTKKNFELLEEATGIVRNGDIYKYNLKIENDEDKKHYGFVIADEGGKFEIPEEVISQTGKGIDTYSMTSILWKACQELIFKVEKLENDIKQLKK